MDIKESVLDFTGERFIPGIEDEQLEIEHFQRYISVLPLVENKIVLDAACGEGYGSCIMAERASRVYGLDINAETIEAAKTKYQEYQNINFLTGSIARIPLPDYSVDIIVSFETIEHVDPSIQDDFLEEIYRVLKPEGCLIMSTPNKEIYSDKYNYHNEFHIKEFYKEEFENFLKRYFREVVLYNQYFEVASILDYGKMAKEEVSFVKNGDYKEEGKYYIAIATNGELPDINISNVYLTKLPMYAEKIERIIHLQKEVEERNRHLHDLDKEIDEKNKRILQLQDEVEEKNRHIAVLNRQNEEVNKENKKFNVEIVQLRLKYETATGNYKQQLIEEKDKIVNLQKQLIEEKDKTEKYRKLLETSSADEWKQKYQNAMEEVVKLKQEVLNKEGHIQLLLPPEREYNKIIHSKMFKIMRFCCATFDVVLFIPKILVKKLAAFIRMLSHVNIPKLKIAWGYVKNEGIAGAYRHLMKDYHQGELKPIDIHVEQTEIEKEEELHIQDCEHLVIPKTSSPVVSIVIPAYNQFRYTYYCIKSIIENSGEEVKYEVILADDCSTDDTTKIRSVVDNLVVVRTKENMLFLRNCNHAAKMAKGKYILFLNNDTQVQKNWLKPLVDLCERDHTVGMTGSKLVYSDGTLQEAGGIIWKDASGWNYGRNDNAMKPEYNYVREVDYISGAAIMIRKELWEQLGGFDEYFAPAYYEDSDLAFQVRKAGYRVVYQPLSVVVHFEGKSNGTDLNTGVKKCQVENQIKFREKWRSTLEKENFPNGIDVYLAKDRSQLKKRILVVDHYVPHYDKDAGGRCTYMYLKLFLKLGMKVTFIGDNFFQHEPYTTELTQLGIEILYGDYYCMHWQEWLKENLHYFDYIYLQRPHIAIKYIDLVKQYAKGKVFYFAHDLHFLRLTREYELTKDPKYLEEAERFRKDEFYLFDKADVVHVVGSYEQAVLQKELPNKTIRNIPLYIYEKLLEDINKDFATRNDLVFVGGFGHPPNIDAVLWFAKEVFPEILKKYPDMKWHIVGGKAPKEVTDLASENIILEGFLSDEDLDKMYRKCRMAVVPLRVGAGVKGKVVEAGYYQIPLVTTSIGEEGISNKEGAFVVEDDAKKMAEVINALYTDYAKLRKMSDAGIELIRNHYMLPEAERVIRQDL